MIVGYLEHMLTVAAWVCVLGACTCAPSDPAALQAVVEDLAARVQTLEAENAALKAGVGEW